MVDRVLGADLSHYQRRPDFDKLVADGVRYVILKATQGMGVDPDFDWNRNEAAKRNMPWSWYPFITALDTIETVKHACKVVGVRIPPAFDWEAKGVPSSTVEMWKKGCEDSAEVTRTGLAYYGVYPPDELTDEIVAMPRWLPEYAKVPKLPAWDGTGVPTDWSGEWFMWQFTGNGRLPGVQSAIDLNYLSCPFEVFSHWYQTGELKPWDILPEDKTPVHMLSPNNEPPQVQTDRVLHLHCSGDDVRAMQRRLAWLGYTVTADGSDGPQTTAAVEAFQTKAGLVADGVAGPLTLRQLNSIRP